MKKKHIGPTAIARASTCIHSWYLECYGDPSNKSKPDAGTLLMFQRGIETHQLQKIRYRNRAGVLKKRCSGTFWTWLHAFPGETRTSPKVTSFMTPHFRKIRNCRVLEVLLPGFGNATSGEREKGNVLIP